VQSFGSCPARQVAMILVVSSIFAAWNYVETTVTNGFCKNKYMEEY
jgi:hypothetical protein